jgi:non-specific serine/threonine protein kinase
MDDAARLTLASMGPSAHPQPTERLTPDFEAVTMPSTPARPLQVTVMSSELPTAPELPAPVALVPIEGRPAGRRLPVPPLRLIGRDAEAGAVSALLRRDGVRLVTLRGPGGVGKTRLALRLAGELRPDFPDGVVFVELAPVLATDLVPSTIANELGLQGGGHLANGAKIAAALRDRRILLVLDNFEHVVSAAPLVAELLSACAGLKVLATSRAKLHLAAEHTFEVLPLAVPEPANATTAGLVAETEAVCLFVERARAAKADFALTDANAGAVAEICRRLDGLPLAIELAAARVDALPPGALLARLVRATRVSPLQVLTGGPRDAPPRLQTMRAAIAWSHDLLSPEDQTLFRRLAVFAGGCTLDAAEGVAADGGDAFDGVVSLLETSLLRQEEGPDGEPRYLMQETIREFGLERLAESGETDAVRARHAAWCLALTKEAYLDAHSGRDYVRWMSRLDAELPNLRAAIAWFDEAGDPTSLLRMLVPIEDFWIFRPYHAEVHRWLEAGLADETVSDEVRAAALSIAVFVDGALGDYAAAAAHAAEALVVARTLDNPFALGRAHYNLGWECEYRGDLARARTHYEDALPLLRASGMPAAALLVFLLGDLGEERLLSGDTARAAELLDDALDFARRVDYPPGLAIVLSHRAHVARAEGDLRRAVRLFTESIDTAREIHAERFVLGAVAGLAGVALTLGQAARAVRLLGAVAAARQAISIGRPSHTLLVDRIEAEARALLGEAAFAGAFAAGRALPFSEAVADALALASAVETTDRTAQPETVRADRFGLSPREREVLCLLAAGKTDREIAEALYISRPTASDHARNIYGKLGVNSRTAAVAIAVHDGLCTPQT